ncbi:hypothetical protein G6F32_016007 [Rhizopus arrhizus]|nr:hypothetical protein G6F32_016007 [Rhizopus arrhizus]
MRALPPDPGRRSFGTDPGRPAGCGGAAGTARRLRFSARRLRNRRCTAPAAPPAPGLPACGSGLPAPRAGSPRSAFRAAPPGAGTAPKR